MSITHAKVSAIADDPLADAAGKVLPSDWNADHVDEFSVMAYGAVADGVTDDGPAFSAAIAAAYASVAYGYVPIPVYVPPGEYRIATPIIVKEHVGLVGYGAALVGPISGYPYIDTPTTAAGATDITAQTGGACFTDDAASGATLGGMRFEGLHLREFRYGFVSKCLSWSFAVWDGVFFENTNIGILAYQGSVGHRLSGTFSGGPAGGTTYVAAATCFPAGHALASLDNFFCDGTIYESKGRRDGSVANADFDTWFAASILRPSTPSVVIDHSDTYGFTGDALKVSGRCIYIPSRNGRQIFRPIVIGCDVFGCDLGAILVADPVAGEFRRVSGETLFGSGPGAMIDVLLRHGDTPATAVFQNIDGVNTTDPGYAIRVIHEPGGSSITAELSNTGGIIGTIVGIEHFTSFGSAPVDVWIGTDDPRAYTITATAPANYATLMAFQVFRPHTVTGATTYVAVQSGNIDVGIYNEAGTSLLGSTGSIACPATGEQTVTFTAPIDLEPGQLYYLAYAPDNGTVSIAARSGIINMSGYIGLGALPLPATLLAPGTPALTSYLWVLGE